VSNIAAQLSLYPLGQITISPAVDDCLKILRGHGLQVVPGSMSTVVIGDVGDVFEALREALKNAMTQGAVVMTVTLSNACPLPQKRRD
jgi:uncharacterized protein YqgV (UPF0045/DUF77 family)